MQNIFEYVNISRNERKIKTDLHTGVRVRVCVCLILFVFVISAFLSSLFVCRVPAYADATSPNTRTVKAGVFGFDGYHMKDSDGKFSGYGIKFLNLVAEYSRLHFQYVGFDNSWDDMLTMLDNGEIDVVTSASRTAAREELYDFSLPIGRRKTVLSVKIDNTKFKRGDYRTYNGMVVGQINGSSQNASLAEFAADKGFSYQIKGYDDQSRLAADLQSGEVDAILSSNLRKAENEKTLDIVEEADFYAIVKKGNSDLINEINYAIEQMDINEGDWKNVLFYQFYGPVFSSALTFTDREKEYIRQVKAGEKSISAIAIGNRAPYSYVEDGRLQGIMLDYFAEVMNLAGLPYNVIVPASADDYRSKIAANEVNVVIDSIGSDGLAEDNTLHRGFRTDSYMSASMAMVTRQDLKSKVKVVAVSESQGKDDLIEHKLLDGYTVNSYPTGEDAMRAVLNKEADAAYVYAYTAQQFVSRDFTDTLYYNVMHDMNTDFGMFIVENTDHELITILNKCIKQMSDDTVNQLALKYISYTAADLSVWQYLQAHPETIVSACAILMLIVCSIVALYLRVRWNRRLLLTTEQSNKTMSEQLAIVEALSRDYINVYTIDEKRGTAKIIKLEGYVVEGLKKDSAEEYNYATVVEKYIRNRVHPEDRDELTQSLSLDVVKEKLAAGTDYVGSYRILDKGETHHFQYAFFKVASTANEKNDFILVGFRNIDEVIRKEQEQKNVLSEALALAQYANKAKTTFLNNMSHDIRTPMNAIIGFTSLAVAHLDNKEQIRGYLGKIMTSGNHLLSLINDVLDMSRIESGKVKIEEKEVSLPEIMHDLKTIVQSDVKAKQLEFYIDTLDVTNETIICDKLRLNQVLLNILSNAMKYTNPGGMVSVRVIQASDAPEGRAAYEFRIKDTGIGMSKEFLKHIFEPFEREQTATVSGIQGTGLGLTITKNIVDMMGGTITVESEPGKGSEFIVKFCFRVSDAPIESQRVDCLANIRALVVDDDVNTCMSVSKMLSAIGMRPDWTTLGHEAIIRAEFALEQSDPFGAYIIDWLMPDMNGIELVRRIRKKIGDTAPVIILTAYDWSDIEKEAREAGVTAFCSKPLFLSELRNVLSAPYAERTVDTVKEKEVRFDGMRLLLVEDNELNQEIAQTVLETAGFVVDTVDDGSVAVEQIKKQPANTYNLILMDVQMPIMNGYDATRAIRALDDCKKANIPIVAMTANAFDEDRKDALDAGMNGYIAKPIDINKMMQLLKEILQ